MLAMAYVDGFEHDVFPSHARRDEKMPEGERGWGSAAEQQHLQIVLKQREDRTEAAGGSSCRGSRAL